MININGLDKYHRNVCNGVNPADKLQIHRLNFLAFSRITGQCGRNQIHSHRKNFLWRIAHQDLSLVGFYNFRSNSQAKPEVAFPAARGIRPVKSFKNAALLFSFSAIVPTHPLLSQLHPSPLPGVLF